MKPHKNTCILCKGTLPAGRGFPLAVTLGNGVQVSCPQCHRMFSGMLAVLRKSWPEFADRQVAGTRAPAPDYSSLL